MDPVRLAFDVGPFQGDRTGIGQRWLRSDTLHAGLRGRRGAYVLRFRSRPTPATRRLPLPAALAHRMWSRRDRPRVDRWLGPTPWS